MTVRIVSLVPSLTELCFDLGLEPQICGRTDYCIKPLGQVAAIPSMGGPKSVDATALRTARPTHVLISPEENLPEIVATIASVGAEAITVHPLAPADNLALYRRFGAVFDRAAEAEALASRLETALAQAEDIRTTTPRLKVLPLIWKDPWVTVSRKTYVAAMLAAVGLETIDTGTALYPRLANLAEAAHRADWLLPTTEPYPFDRAEVAALKTELGRDTVALVDGEAVAWYGSRAIAALPWLVAFKRRLLDSAPERS